MLLDAVESVHASTYRDVEIIISADGSADQETLSVLDELEKQQGIQVLRHPNQGVSAARNAGVAASTGRYLMMLDADDRIEPTYIEKAVAVLKKSQIRLFVMQRRVSLESATSRGRFPLSVWGKCWRITLSLSHPLCGVKPFSP